MLDGLDKKKPVARISFKDLEKISNKSSRPKLDDFKIRKTVKIKAKEKSTSYKIKVFSEKFRSIKPRTLALLLTGFFVIILGIWFFCYSETFAIIKLYYGLENKSVIIGLQNSAELRPTGGFWGSFIYAEIPSKVNKAQLFFETNPYKNDNPLLKTTSVAMPKPLAQTWSDRPQSFVNANWPIDFGESAKTIQWYFGQGWNQKSDAVVAVSSLAMIDLLKLTGPITMPDGTAMNSENFTQIMSQKIDTEYWQTSANIQTNEPKTLIKEMFPTVLKKAKSLPITALYKYAKDQISEGRILVYFNDQKLNEVAKKLGISGSLIPYSVDYLSINNANLNGGKSSLNVYQNINLDVTKTDSQIISNLDLTRSYKSGSWPVTVNRNYTRVVVPLGSTLLSAKLQDDDITGSVDVTEESGRTVFGFWFNVGSGEVKKASIRYCSAYKIDNFSQYNLILQKQPGTNSDDVNVTVFGKRLFSGINNYVELSVP